MHWERDERYENHAQHEVALTRVDNVCLVLKCEFDTMIRYSACSNCSVIASVDTAVAMMHCALDEMTER